MNKELLAWIEELETTDAKQGVGRLRSPDDELCCLGVACERAVRAGVIAEPVLGRTPEANGAYEYHDGTWAILPGEVAMWLGIDDCAGFELGDLPAELVDELERLASYTSSAAQTIADWKNSGEFTAGGLSMAMLNDAKISFKDIARVARVVYADQLVPA